MRLFLYGTLIDPGALAMRSGDPSLPERCQGAALRGWRRVTLAGAPWPTLRREAGGTVTGKIVAAGATAMRMLRAYEEPPYRLHRVVVRTVSGPEAAWTWIAPGGTNRPWTQRSKQGVSA